MIKKQSNFFRNILIVFLAFFLFIICSSSGIVRKSIVHFTAEDGTVITADHYFIKNSLPYIILLHQEFSSRGEFDPIAEKIMKLGYNGLAVDLRSGEKYGYIDNETAKSLQEQNKYVHTMDALKDISAAVEYAWNLSGQKLVLLGSGISASLALIEAKNNDHIKAVIALSPGEYFRPGLEMKSYLSDFSKMTYVACTSTEYTFIQEMFSEMDNTSKIIFRPSSGPGARGAMALHDNNPTRDEYWLSLLLFFRTIR